MASSEYQKKLQSPKWQKKRLEIFKRDEFTCQLCQAKDKTLHIHHMEYAKSFNPWDVPDEKLITYCDDCHKIVELNKHPTLVFKIEKIKEIHNNCFLVYSKFKYDQVDIRIVQKEPNGEILFVTGLMDEELSDLIEYVTKN